jgi:biopolymer transport protein ExbB/biopolymer transport protein TolQ
MLVDRLLKIALLGSEWVLYLLVALSVLSLATMVERWVFFFRRRDDLDRLRRGLVAELDTGDVAGATRFLEKSPSIEARLAREALRWAYAGPEAIADAVDAELLRQKAQLERGTNLLGTLGNNAPFVGLLGTVLGVIIAFDALGGAGQNMGAMGGVMSGIAEALVATGVGLFVALPAVVAYNLIQKRIGQIETEAISLTKLITAYARAHGPDFGLFDADVLPDALLADDASSEATPSAAAALPQSDVERVRRATSVA